MAKLQGFKRIIVEDFEQKDRNLISKLAYSINVTIEDILNSLNKNLTIYDNLALNQKTITVTVNSEGIPTSTTLLSSGLNSTCTGMTVIKATSKTNSSLSPINMPFITFIDNSGQITIQKITGLQVNNTYSLQVILWS